MQLRPYWLRLSSPGRILLSRKKATRALPVVSWSCGKRETLPQAGGKDKAWDTICAVRLWTARTEWCLLVSFCFPSGHFLRWYWTSQAFCSSHLHKLQLMHCDVVIYWTAAPATASPSLDRQGWFLGSSPPSPPLGIQASAAHRSLSARGAQFQRISSAALA